jgi:nitrogen fixation NifU-like protein
MQPDEERELEIVSRTTRVWIAEGQGGMSTGFDRSMEELERQIIEQARTIYSDKVVDAFYYPQNLGHMSEPDARGLVHGWCGDTMEIYLRLKEERIEEARFTTDGCGPTVACGSVLTTMVRGMSLTQAGEIRPEDLLEALDGLPEENAHCAELAVKTLRNALLNLRVGNVYGTKCT